MRLVDWGVCRVVYASSKQKNGGNMIKRERAHNHIIRTILVLSIVVVRHVQFNMSFQQSQFDVRRNFSVHCLSLLYHTPILLSYHHLRTPGGGGGLFGGTTLSCPAMKRQ